VSSYAVFGLLMNSFVLVMRLLKPSLFSSLPFYKGNENNSNIFDKILLEQ
jgi:hypothetical protein